MKQLTYFLILLLHTGTVYSQITQKGLVREFNSGKQPITGVGIQFIGAVSTESDVEGKFELRFNSIKKYGDPISFVEAKKAGYEVVNETNMHSLRLSSDNILQTDLILAKTGVIQTAKAEYAGASLKALTQGYEREKAILLKKVNAAQLKEEEYNEQIRLLSKEYEKQQARLDALAQTFARVNFDDVDEAYKEALELYKEGKLDEAIAILESQDLAKQTRDILLEIKRIATAKAQISEDERILSEKKNQHIEMLSSLADMYNLNFNPVKAEGIMDTLLLLDSTDINILQKAADFYLEQHKYSKAIVLYMQIIAHPNTQEWQIANAKGYLGDLYKATGDLNQALVNYEKHFSAYQDMYKSDSTSFNKNGLASSYSKLGEVYISLSNLQKAMECNEKFNFLIKELFNIFPDNSNYKNGLAISYQNLGNTHRLMGNTNRSLEFYEKYNILEKELVDTDPGNVKFRSNLAISYQYLGYTHASMGNLDKALEFYNKYNILNKELSVAFPYNVTFKNGLASSYYTLGHTYSSIGDLDKALKSNKQFNIIMNELFDAYPNNVNFKNGLAISYQNLGNTYTSTADYTKALVCYEKYNIIEKELVDTFPDNVEFKNNLAISFQHLGRTFASLGNLNNGLSNYEKYNILSKELFEAFPDNVIFKNGLASSHSTLGEIYTLLGNLEKALENYYIFNTLISELFDVSNFDIDYKNGLAMSFQNLGDTHASMGNKDTALKFYNKFNILRKELHEAYQDNVSFKEEFAISLEKLGLIYIEFDKEKATNYLIQARQHIEELIESEPDKIKYKNKLASISDILKNNNKH